MQNSKTDALAKYLRETLIQARDESGITQEEMAAQLDISLRCFSDIECGHSTFGLRSFLLFYLRYCKNKEGFFDDVEEIIEEILNNDCA